MAQDAQHQSTREAILCRAAETAARSGRTQAVEFKGVTLAISRLKPRKRRAHRSAATLSPVEREEILRATSGGWKGLVDPDELKRELNDMQEDDSLPRSLWTICSTLTQLSTTSRQNPAF